MKKVGFIGLLILMVLLSGCVSGPTGTPTATPSATSQTGANTIEIKGFTFVPDTLTVPVGTTVTWINRDSAPHTVTSTTKVFDSGSINQGKTFNYTFNKAGTYEYECTIHPSIPHGKVIVT